MIPSCRSRAFGRAVTARDMTGLVFACVSAALCIAYGATLGAQSTRPARPQPSAKESPAPFVVDSSYDKFEDTHTVSIHSRIIPTSIPGLRFMLVARCDPNAACVFDDAFLALGTAAMTSQQRTVFGELSNDITCIALLFHSAPADTATARGSACFRRQAAVQQGKQAAVSTIDVNAGLLDSAFRHASWFEGRFGVVPTKNAIQFRVGADTLVRAQAFFAEIDRRSVRTP